MHLDSRGNPGASRGSVGRFGSGAWLIGLLALTHASAFIDRSLPSVLAPSLKSAFVLSDAQLGALQGPFFIALFTAATLCAGFVTDHPWRLRIMAACVAVWSVGMALFAYAQDYAWLATGRMVVGLGQALFAPCALALIVSGSRDEVRARSISVFTAGSSVGRSIAFLLGGAALAGVAALAVGAPADRWRVVCILMTAPNLLLIVGLLSVREPGQRSAESAGGLRPAGLYLLSKPAAAASVFAGASAAVLAIQTISAWGASILNRQFGVAPAQAALVFGAVLVPAALAGHLGGGWLLDRLTRNGWTPGGLLAAGLALAAVGTGAATQAPGPWWAGVALGVGALGASTATLAGLVGVQALSPARLRGPIGAIFLAFTGFVGLGIGPLAVGLVSDHGRGGASGLSAALWLCVATVALIGGGAALAGRGAWRRAGAAATAGAQRPVPRG